MLIHPKETPSAQMEVSFNGHTLTQVLSTHFLGLISDVLSWTEHIYALSRKVAQKTGALDLALWTLTGPVIKMPLLYITVIQPDLLYGASAFYHGLSAHEKDRFTSLSKSAVRAICRVPPWTPRAPLFTRLNLHTPYACIQVKQLSICYRSFHGLASPYCFSLY